jgi:hypothetical protein
VRRREAGCGGPEAKPLTGTWSNQGGRVRWVRLRRSASPKANARPGKVWMAGTEGKSSKVIEGDLAAHPGKAGQAANIANSGPCVQCKESDEPVVVRNPGPKNRSNAREGKTRGTMRQVAWHAPRPKAGRRGRRGEPAGRLEGSQNRPRKWSRKPKRGAPRGYVPPMAKSRLRNEGTASLE